MDSTSTARELAREVGFDLCGVAPVAPPPARAHFEAWLDRGFHAGMSWLERGRARTCDPASIRPGTRSILVVGHVHAREPVELAGGGRVARYAAGRDYHNVIGRMLAKLARRLEGLGWVERWRRHVDAGPLMERSHAAAAGLGFESKAANLLDARAGPWFFLGGLLVDAELEPTTAAAPGSCGTCRACLDACPTAAIVEPGVVDANRCISYHTIENRGAVPRELRDRFGSWVFGCDVCSEVCPWGSRASGGASRYGTHAAVGAGRLTDWLQLGAAEFASAFRGSPLTRARREGLARNAAIALGNAPTEEGKDALLAALERDASPLVRESAAWALGHAHASDDGVPAALGRAAQREPDLDARRGIEQSLSVRASG